MAFALLPVLAQREASMPPAPGRSLPVRPAGLIVVPQGGALLLTASAAGTLELPDKLMGLATDASVLFKVADEPLPVTIRWRGGHLISEWLVGSLPQAELFCYDFGPWRLRAAGATRPTTALALMPADPMIAAETLVYHSDVLVFAQGEADGLTVAYTPEEEPPPHCGLFQWSAEQGRWRFLAPLQADLPIALASLAPLVIAADLAPPILRQPRYATVAEGLRLVIPLSDPETGIEPTSIRVIGEAGELSCSYDAGAGWILLPEDAGGPFAVQAADRAGNLTEVERLSP